MENDLAADIALGVAIVAAIGLLIGLNIYFKKRKKGEKLRKLQAIATQSSGWVGTGEYAAAPRSATIRPPSTGQSAGWLDSVMMERPPSWELTLDLWRGRWFVRAAQSSCEKASVTGPGNTTTIIDSRIDVALAPCPALKVSVFVEYKGDPQGIEFGSPEQPPRALADAGPQGNGSWKQVSLPAHYAARMRAFSTDLDFASAVLNNESLEWLTQYLPPLHTDLTIENGLLFISGGREIDPDTILQKVDVLVGFLDRTPLQPGNQAARSGAPQR